MTETLIQWRVRADRRVVSWARVASELSEIVETLDGLEVVWCEDYDQAPDQGAFRDFVAVATAQAADKRVLEAMAEELLLELGFCIDFKPLSRV